MMTKDDNDRSLCLSTTTVLSFQTQSQVQALALLKYLPFNADQKVFHHLIFFHVCKFLYYNRPSSVFLLVDCCCCLFFVVLGVFLFVWLFFFLS